MTIMMMIMMMMVVVLMVMMMKMEKGMMIRAELADRMPVDVVGLHGDDGRQ